jgi:hypothetical protein
MSYRFRRYSAVHVTLLGAAPLLAALAACAGSVTPDWPPDPTGGPDASPDAPADPPDAAPPDAAPADAAADAYQGIIGEPCAGDSDCGAGYRCHLTVPNGYCTANCASDVPCPGGSVCSPVPYSRVSGACMRPCGSTAECRPEYVCDYVVLFPGDPGSPKSPAPVCWEPWDKDSGP